MDQAIGTALTGILANVTVETGSNAPSTEGSKLVRLNDQQLAAMEATANLPLAAPPRCDDDHFEKSMRALALLPRRADDDMKGELRIAIYRRMIGGYSKEAISFLAETALAELEWFPSPKQCLDILARWKRNDEAVHKQAMAGKLARAERQARFDDTMGALDRRELDQAQIDALPERMRDIAAERGFLRRHDDGVYRARPVPVPTNG